MRCRITCAATAFDPSVASVACFLDERYAADFYATLATTSSLHTRKLTMKSRFKKRSSHLAFLHDGFDRVNFWIDRPTLPFDVQRLAPHCGDLFFTAAQPRYHANRKGHLALYQPTASCLQMLRDLCGAEIGIELVYAEINRDLGFKNVQQLSAMRNAFLESAYMPYQRCLVSEFNGTLYWGVRSNAAHRQGSVMCLYTDRPNKVMSASPNMRSNPCFHLEWRVSGKAALARLGLRALDDLINFDHVGHWEDNLNLYQLPSKTDLGRLLAKLDGGSPDVSSVAYLKRANRWLDAHRIDGQFVLHNALKTTPNVARHLPRNTWLKLVLSCE